MKKDKALELSKKYDRKNRISHTKETQKKINYIIKEIDQKIIYRVKEGRTETYWSPNDFSQRFSDYIVSKVIQYYISKGYRITNDNNRSFEIKWGEE